MMLFDDFERSDVEPAAHGEKMFEFLNNSAWESAERVRKLLEGWFVRYPELDKADLASRYRSDYPYASFFELSLHALLERLGCKVTVHPEVAGTSNRPDFLAECEDGGRFYLEAAITTGTTEKGRAAGKRVGEVYKILDQIESPNLFLGLRLRGAPQSPPSARKIKEFVQQELQRLNADEIAEAYERSDGILREAGEKLNVTHVLEGSVRKAGNRCRSGKGERIHLAS